MKYKKFFTIMQAAVGIVPLNKREFLPPPRRLWKAHEDQYASELFPSTFSRENNYWTSESQHMYLAELRRASIRSFTQLWQCHVTGRNIQEMLRVTFLGSIHPLHPEKQRMCFRHYSVKN
ncbi:hypothetical protein DNTS_007894 [Danionella cerebrum]|uniref:Uncharacterized protein n=1 Tax=Danionella cerebrum TaxID=2873325 RepID=A0A553PXN7_9TELE|nr:hypothetical protein DNTS_007894 [Danionella translucida]